MHVFPCVFYARLLTVALACCWPGTGTFFYRVGMVLTYVTNDRMSDAIDDVEDEINTNLGDIVTYLDNTVAVRHRPMLGTYDNCCA